VRDSTLLGGERSRLGRTMNSEVTFSVVGGSIEQLAEVSLKEIGFKERQDLQHWIESYPEIVGPDLLVITTEFDRWEFGDKRVRDRLDVLSLTPLDLWWLPS
jgi:hypothetical protein